MELRGQEPELVAEQITHSLVYGLNSLRNLLFQRIHEDVEANFGHDSMLLPISVEASEHVAKCEIESYQIAVTAVAVQERGYVHGDAKWFTSGSRNCGWVTTCRTASGAAVFGSTWRFQKTSSGWIFPGISRRCFPRRVGHRSSCIGCFRCPSASCRPWPSGITSKRRNCVIDRHSGFQPSVTATIATADHWTTANCVRCAATRCGRTIGCVPTETELTETFRRAAARDGTVQPPQQAASCAVSAIRERISICRSLSRPWRPPAPWLLASGSLAKPSRCA